MWAITSSTEYLYHVEPYCGASTKLPATGNGQGYDVPVGLIDKCEVKRGHYVYFDNLFTSLTLLDELSSRGIGGCGTVRENILEGAPL